MLGIESAIFPEDNYKELPFEVKKDSFNMLGIYKVKKSLFSSKGSLIYVSNMDQQKEYEFKTEILEANCNWNKFFTINESIVNSLTTK